MPYVQIIIARAQQRFGKMRHIWWNKELHVNLRMRLYKSSVCSILTYGSEAWYLTAAVKRALNGANAQMMSVITGKTQHQEASKKWQTFDLVKWVRARRLQWLGHILRMDNGMNNERPRMVKKAIYVMFKARSEGDMLMDAPKHDSWKELCT